MLRLPFAVCAFIFLMLFMPLPRFTTGPAAFEKLSVDRKHAVLDKAASRMAKYLVDKGNLSLIEIDPNIENKTLLILLRENFTHSTSDSEISAVFRKFNRDLCQEMRSTDMYKSEIKLTIEFQRRSGAHLESIVVGKQDCAT